MPIANTALIPFNVTGGITTYVFDGNLYNPSSADTLVGYTNHLTTFKCSVTGTPADISNDALIWDFGDGTYVKGFSAEHNMLFH